MIAHEEAPLLSARAIAYGDAPAPLSALPPVVRAAVWDRRLQSVSRIMIVMLTERLDIYTYRELTAKEVGGWMGVSRPRAASAMTELVEQGYLDRKRQHRETSLYRFPLSRLPMSEARAPRRGRGRPFERRTPLIVTASPQIVFSP